MRLDPIVSRAIADCPLPVVLEPHKRHLLVRVGGRVVSKLPKGSAHGFGRASMNVRAAIKRAARQGKPA